MIQYSTLNEKLHNSQLNKLKSGTRNGTEVTLNFPSTMVGNFNGETYFLHRLLLTNRHVLRLSKDFVNSSSANIKLSKTQLYKIGQSGGFLSRLLGPLLNTGLPWMKNVLKTLAKSVLKPLGLAAAAATDAAIRKKFFGSGMTTLIIANTLIIKSCKF